MFGKIAVKIIFLEDEEFFYKIPFDLRTLKGEEISFSIKAKDPMIISGVYNSISIMDQGDVTKIKGVQSWLKQSELNLISIQEIDIDKKYLEELGNSKIVMGKKIEKNSPWFKIRRFFKNEDD